MEKKPSSKSKISKPKNEPKPSKSSIPTKTSKVSKLPKDSSSKSSKLPTQKEPSKPKVKEVITPPSNDYEDDFEEYESDFEEDVSVIEPLKRESARSIASPPKIEKYEEVVESDNESESFLMNRIKHAKSPIISVNVPIIKTSGENRPTTSTNRVFRFENKAINMETLLKSVGIFQKMKSEGRLGKQFIQSVDIAPNRVSEIYNNLIENSTSSRRYTQTGDDSLENYSQTTPRGSIDKANQFPTIFVKLEISAQKQARQNRENSNFATAERFLKFVGISGRTFISLLGTNKTNETIHLPLRSNVEFSSGFAQFSLEKLAKKSRSIGIEVRRGNEPRILVGFYVEESDRKQFNDKSILLEYNFEDMEQPINAYLTSDKITDFCYSSDGNSLIFAGQKSGNCLLFDLVNKNQRMDIENIPQLEFDKKLNPQFSSYSTSYISVERKKHAFIHQSDQCILRTQALSSKEPSGQQQFLSLSVGGIATIWAVTRDQSASNIDEDLGLGLSSLIRLMKISSNVCSTVIGFGSAAQVALCLDTKFEEFIAGMSSGLVVRVSRGKQNDKRLRHYNLTSGSNNYQSQLSANCLCFSQHNSDYFAVGASNGSLLIFETDKPNAIMEIQLREERRGYRINQLTNLIWSHSHAQILYALYDSRYFAIWDISSTNIEPEIVDLFQKFNSNVIRMFSWNSVNNTLYMAFTLTSGQILLHELHRPSASNMNIRKLFEEP